jgi:hypothetical protein
MVVIGDGVINIERIEKIEAVIYSRARKGEMV